MKELLLCLIFLFIGYKIFNIYLYECFNDSNNIMKEYNIIIGGTCRNVETYIENIIIHIDKCGEKFKSYHFIVYENDSTDKTREILLQHKKINYTYIFEDNITEPLRTKRLANGRNKILDLARELNKNNDYEYLLLLDLDDVNRNGTFSTTIEKCFDEKINPESWAVQTANQKGNYYDLWALRKKDDMEYDCWKTVNENLDDPNVIEKYVSSKIKSYYNETDEIELLPVDSAFGGSAIYNLNKIPLECKYVGHYLSNENIEKCEHVELNECIKNNGGNLYINTQFLNDA